MKSPFLACILLSACGLNAVSQPSSGQSPHTLLVTVLDSNGNSVRDLAKDNFRVKVNGQPVPLRDIHYSVAPRRIVVLLDVSGSMAGDTGNKKWRIACEAVADLLEQTPAEMKVALLTFSTHVQDVFDFSQPRASIDAWLKLESSRQHSIKISGRTALYDAIVAATKLLALAQPGDSIYAVTDGWDNNSRVSGIDTRNLLLQSGVRLFVLFLAQPPPMGVEQTGKDYVILIASATGGSTFGVSAHQVPVSFLPSWNAEYDYDERTRERIALYAREINVQLNTFYILQWKAPLSNNKLNKVSIEVLDGNGKVKKDVALRYPEAFLGQGK